MKNKVKLIISAITVMVFVVAFNFVNAQAPVCVVNYNGTGLSPGATINIPINLTGTQVGSFQLLLQYDRDVLTYVSETHTLASGFFGVFPSFTHATLPGQTFCKIQYAYTGAGSGASFSNEDIVTLQFTFNGGSTNISYYNISTTVAQTGAQYTFIKANPYTVINLGTTFTNGSVSGGCTTLHSIITGGDWKTAATWEENIIPSNAYDVIITGNTVTDTSTTGRCHDLTINPGGKLTVNPLKLLGIAGNMIIKSDASATGSFLNNGTSTVAGTTSVERWVTANWTVGYPDPATTWHYVSSPVSGATIGTFLGSLLNHWSEPLEWWVVDTLPLSIPLIPAIGYSLAKHIPDGIVTFTGGTLNNNTSYSPPITFTAGVFAGWNLLGNPYPCAISWDLITNRPNVAGAVYTWDGVAKNYVSYSGGVGGLSGGIIPAEQAFFVQATTTGASITIPNTARLHSGQGLYKNTIENLLSFQIQGSDVAKDMTYVHFISGATAGFDLEYDAYKLSGAEDAPQLYSIVGSDILSINSLPDVTSKPVIPMGLKVGLSDTYTITATDLETFSAGTEIFLEDILANKVQDLTKNPSYTFSASPGDVIHRFNVKFSSVGFSENRTSSINIYSFERTVYVNIPNDMSGNIVIYNLLGSEIARTVIQSNSLNKINLDVPSGFYLVKVDGNSNSTAGKIFIR